MMAWWLWMWACGVPQGPETGTEVSTVLPYASPLRRMSPSQFDNTLRDLFDGVDTPTQMLPADPLFYGFDNNPAGQYPSALLVEQVQGAAIEVTARAVATPGWLPCAVDGGLDPAGCGRDVLEPFVVRAYRRPVTEGERETLLAFFDQMLAEEGFEVAIQLALQAVLNSPDFLYLPELGATLGRGGPLPLGPYELASRMSYFLWNSMPDEALMAAAAAGELDHVEGVEAQAWRMLEDDRAATAWAHFHHQWLGLERLETVAPDPESYPSWSPALRVSMEVETHDFVVETLRGSDPTFRALLVGRETHADATLADLYDLSAGETSLDPRERAGVLTRSAWLTATSHPVHPSPVQRGVFVLERMLCTPVSSPPADVNTEIAPPVEAMTNRERYAQHTADPACAGCHTAIDPLGFAFENYDSIGRHRVMDYGLGIDASGVFTEGDLAGVGFEDGVSISEQMASSQTVHDCFVRHWLRSAHGADLPPDDLGRSFSDTGGHIPQLLVDIVRSERFRSLR